MRRRVAIVGAALAASAAGVALMPNAQAASLCVTYDISVNDQGAADTVCLPPEGTPAPELPPLP